MLRVCIDGGVFVGRCVGEAVYRTVVGVGVFIAIGAEVGASTTGVQADSRRKSVTRSISFLSIGLLYLNKSGASTRSWEVCV
jgi:hypothetical protein